MEKIEIRYNRKKLVIVILFCFFWVIVTTLIIFNTEPYSRYTIIKTLTVLVNIFVLYVGCVQIKLFIKNAPVLTLSETGLLFNNNGNEAFFLWTEITNLAIKKVRAGNRGTTDMLMITSNGEAKQIPLAPLEKSIADIRDSINTYWRKPWST